eukprot:3200686-Pleurochrysis_carterae.AAC.1
MSNGVSPSRSQRSRRGRSSRSAGIASQWTCGSASTSGRAGQRGAVAPSDNSLPDREGRRRTQRRGASASS